MTTAGMIIDGTLRLVDNKKYFLLTRNDILDISKSKPLKQLDMLDLKQTSCSIEQFKEAYVVMIADGEETHMMKNRFGNTG